MNRKMRANLNNKIAKVKKARREQRVCDKCGEDMKEHVPLEFVGVLATEDKTIPVFKEISSKGHTLQ